MCRYCVIDFETTGLSALSCEVVQYAAVRVENREVGLNLSSLCRPHNPIPYSATRVHGITDRMVRFAQPFQEHLPGLIDFIGNDTVVAHNIPFDMSFLRRYCDMGNISFSPPTLCTLAMARSLFPQLPSKSLSSVAQHLNITGGQYHDALGDALITAKILIKMLEMKGT